MIDKNEVSFYPNICEKIKEHLISIMPSNAEIAYSYDKTLPDMIKELESQLNVKSDYSESYIPSLKLDILIGIKLAEKIRLLLIEVKYAECLNLLNFSQLAGYLQVAKKIKHGLLLLICKNPDKNTISNDLANILKMGNLPLEWQVVFNKLNSSLNFRVGIVSFIPRNGFQWFNTSKCFGYESFEDLAKDILS